MANEIAETKLEKCRNKLLANQDLTATDANEAIDEIIDNEVNRIMTAIEEGTIVTRMSSWFRGFYYLTFARLFNPTAYNMDWSAVKKINDRQRENGNAN
jgi:predicted sugar kinase